MTARGQVKVGVVGLGYWGRNVARNLDRIRACELGWCCDIAGLQATQGSTAFGKARFTANLDELLEDEALDAIAIATPVSTHASIAVRALEAGKHCFVEKPLAQTVADAERITALAAAQNRILMAGHLLEYHPAVVTLKSLVEEGDLGEIHYIYSQRLNLGKLRSDENALWSLGAHDVSTILALLGEFPCKVSARGESFVREGIEDVVFGYLRFSSGISARMHLSWLDPHKERRLTVVGSKRMATFDDMAEGRKLTIYDKGFDPDDGPAEDYVPRSGMARTPKIDNSEPLQLELEHFVDCVAAGHTPRSDGISGVRVVRVLDALQSSLECDGASMEPMQDPVR